MNYYEKILTSNTKIAIVYIAKSVLFKYGNGIFNFSKKFTLTNTVKNTLFSAGTYGVIVGVVIIPVATSLDIAIFILGISIGCCLYALGAISFPAILIWLLIK